jgi:hypothetical protein
MMNAVLEIIAINALAGGAINLQRTSWVAFPFGFGKGEATLFFSPLPGGRSSN